MGRFAVPGEGDDPGIPAHPGIRSPAACVLVAIDSSLRLPSAAASQDFGGRTRRRHTHAPTPLVVLSRGHLREPAPRAEARRRRAMQPTSVPTPRAVQHFGRGAPLPGPRRADAGSTAPAARVHITCVDGARRARALAAPLMRIRHPAPCSKCAGAPQCPLPVGAEPLGPLRAGTPCRAV
eukprot:7988026-Alexandrium_andersonii.AAC.1